MQSNNNNSGEEDIKIFVQEIPEHEFKIFDWKDYRIAYFICRHRSSQTPNEDALFIHSRDNALFFGVSDGAGGHPKGKEASHLACTKIMKIIDQNELNQLKMVDMIESVNDKIVDLKVGAHSTLVLTSIIDDNLRSFSVGDSEIVYWNGHGNELYSNIPHSEVGYRIEAGVLHQEESLDDPDRHSVNNLLGDPSIRIEVATKMKIKKGHTILIGSDGLFDNISHEQLTEHVGKGGFDKSFELLCETCIKQSEGTWKKDDDISFILVRKIKA